MTELKWELLDEKGHEIWHATLEGSVLTIVSGPVDGKQKTQTKDHGDEAKAQKALRTAMTKQQKAGFHDPTAPWPLPVVTDDIPESDQFMMFILPQDRKRSYRVRLIDIIPAHLAKYRDNYGSFFEGPKNSHFWFKNRVHVGRGHFIRPVEPPMNGDTKDFPLAYSPEFLSARPDCEAVILAYKTTLYEVEIETGGARPLHTFADVATLRGTRRFRYAPDGVNVLWRDLTQKNTIVRLKDGVAKPWLETTGEILDFRRLADGSIALITENFFERWVEESDSAKLTHQMAVRKGWGLGTWLDGKAVLLFTRSPADAQTYYLGVSELGFHLMGVGKRRLRWADDVRGTQWCVECMPGGDVDGNVCRMYNVQNVYQKALNEPVLAADHVFERPSLHDAIAGIRDFSSADLVEKAIKLGADLEARSAHGWPPLAYAAWLFDRTDLVQVLLDAKCDLQACDHNGLNALANALLKDHLTVAKWLLEAGVDPAAQGSVTIDGKEVRLHAPIAEAAGQGAHEIVEKMLERGADPSATDAKGYTPVVRALLRGHEELADFLLKAGGKLKSQEASDPSPLLDLCRSVPHRVTEFTEELKGDIVGQPGANALHYYLAEEWSSKKEPLLSVATARGHRFTRLLGLVRPRSRLFYWNVVLCLKIQRQTVEPL